MSTQRRSNVYPCALIFTGGLAGVCAAGAPSGLEPWVPTNGSQTFGSLRDVAQGVDTPASQARTALTSGLLRQPEEPGFEGGTEDDASVPIDQADWDFGVKGQWRWMLYGGAAREYDDNAEQYNLHVAASYFLVDDLSVNFELGGIFFDEDSRGDDALGGNFNILFRWHMISRDTWSFYADGGAGMILISEEVPVSGTNFNFTPQAGLGFSFDVGDDGARLMTGVRWHHMSNARIKGGDDNPGRDSIMGYVGLSFPIE